MFSPINFKQKTIRNLFPGFTAQVIVALLAVFFAGCAAQPQFTLMPTPVMYYDSKIDPFKHLSPERQTPSSRVHYATNRAPVYKNGVLEYGNNHESKIHLGTATIHMGSQDANWQDLHEKSLAKYLPEPVPLTVEEITEYAMLPKDDIHQNHSLTSEQLAFFESINAELDQVTEKEIMVYVHGTKVNFSHSTILTAEIEHFAGRDFVGVAFAWPSHQNILPYLFGFDVEHAQKSSIALKSLLILLAKHTHAKQINLLSYSAGGKVVSKALYEIRNTFSDLDSDELRKKLRLGSIVFAAVDVEVDVFLHRLIPISELAQQVVITISDNDNALKAAKKFMGGTFRTGSAEAEISEETFILENNLSNVEIIDVSIGKEVRGFDIVGHHYWYRHPWMSSDIIFLMRTNLPPSRRGLSPTEQESIWYLSNGYPEKIRQAVESELKGQW